MPISFDTVLDEFTIEPNVCGCGSPLYESGCTAPGCSGRGCQECGTGCDLDFVDDGRCATALAEEDDDERDERLNRERAAFGLPRIGRADS